MSVFVLKLIGIISMIFDHSGYIFFKRFTFMNYIGRFAFPIFAFLIAEGFSHTKDVKKYFFRLLLFAAISQIPFMLFMHAFSTGFEVNILFTFSLGLLMLISFEKVNNKFLKLLILVLACTISQLLKFDYGWFGISCIFIFYKFKDNKLVMNSLFILCVIIKNLIGYFYSYRIEYFIIILFSILALIPLNFYNGKKGKSLKYFFYIFYPAHLFLLYLISIFIN